MAVTCDDVELGSGGMLACLVERSADVDGQCRDVMASYDLLN